jgi:serine/threonine protein kinase
MSPLGQGGMGAVFRVADTLQGDREVALKLIQAPGGIDSELNLRFKEEFRAMVKLKHPNTIEVFDYGRLDDQSHYLTMEIVSGQVLSDCIKQSLPLEQVSSILIQLLQALGFIHSRLYVHRDIKADNIRIREDGTVKLMDFGLMTQLGIPANGKLTGTPGYLPPEVAKGGIINASSDLYSVGCLAYEMLAGHLPFRGDLLKVVQGHIGEPPAPLGAFRPDLPPRLAQIVMRLLEKDQKLRYQQAAEVMADLSDLTGISITRVNLEQKKSYLTSSALVGRDKELKQLEEGLVDVQAGKGRSIFVGAPAGIGKSRLVHELLLQAKLNDMPVLHGQCLESGMATYEPLAQALRPVIALSTPDELERFGPVLTRILPELQPHSPPPPRLDANLERLRLNETVVAWLSSVSARGPLVLFFDDLHWSDSNSLETLNYCIREMSSDRLYVLATFRNDEVTSSSPLWFTLEEGLTQYLKLSAFNLPQVLLLLQAMLCDFKISAPFSQFLYDSTAGNAFFLTEMVRYLMEQDVLILQDGVWTFPPEVGTLVLPASIEETVVRRLTQLSDDASALARVAAVLGRYQEREMLLAVSGLDEERLFAHLDELTERQFILKEEDRYTFPHDRVREALYDDLAEEERRRLHQRCGEYLERRFADSRDGLTNELAYHFSHGRDRLKAYEYLRLAGDRARAAGVVAIALENWRQAEALLAAIDYPRKEAHQAELWWLIGASGYELAPATAIGAIEKLITHLEAQGNVEGTSGLFKKVGALIQKLPPKLRDKALAQVTKPKSYRHRARNGLVRRLPLLDPAWLSRLVEAYGLLNASYGHVGQPSKGLEAIQRALHLLPFPGTVVEGALLLGRCVSLLPAGRFDELLRCSIRARELMGEADVTGQLVLQIAQIGSAGYQNTVSFQGIRPDAALHEYGLQAAERIHAFNLIGAIWSRHGIWYAWTGRYDEAMHVIDQITQNSRKIGAPPYYWVLYLRPFLAWQKGEFEEARTLIHQALQYSHLDRGSFAEQSLLVLRGLNHLSLKELEAAEADFESAERQSRKEQLSLVTIQALIGMGQLAKVRGDMAAASRHLGEAYQIAVGGPARNPLHQAIAGRLMGEVALAQGEFSTAAACFGQAMEIVARPEQDNLIEQGHLHRARGELSLACREREAAKVAFRRAAELFAGLKNAYLLRQVTKYLEALTEGAEPIVHSPLLEESEADRVATLTSGWQLRLIPTHRSAEEFYQTILACCETDLRATEVSFFLCEPEITWVASRSHGAPAQRLPVNEAFLSQVLATKEGLTAFDVPAELEVGTGTNMEMEVSSVLLSPIRVNGDIKALLYLVNRDLSEPYFEKDLEALSALALVTETAMAQLPTP